MKIKLAHLSYIFVINAIAAMLWLHLIGKQKLSNLNLTLIIIFGIFGTLVFSEVVFKDAKNDRKKN